MMPCSLPFYPSWFVALPLGVTGRLYSVIVSISEHILYKCFKFKR